LERYRFADLASTPLAIPERAFAVGPLAWLLALLLRLLDGRDLLNVRADLRLLHLFVEMGKLCGRFAVVCLLAAHDVVFLVEVVDSTIDYTLASLEAMSMF
jgi:hypothetical protein